MEVKTCEQYVLNELETVYEEFEVLIDDYNRLVDENAALEFKVAKVAELISSMFKLDTVDGQQGYVCEGKRIPKEHYMYSIIESLYGELYS